MPAGVSWPTYLKFFIAAGLSMFAGSHTVHTFYRYLVDYKGQVLYLLILNCCRPLDDMEAWFQRFEAEERRQRTIAEVMKEQKDSAKTVESETAGKGDGQGNGEAVKTTVEGKVEQAVA